MSSQNDEIYKNRDIMLGEIFENSKNTKITLAAINKWCLEHDKKDDTRFFWGAVAIIILAAAAGVLPQITSLAMEHIKP